MQGMGHGEVTKTLEHDAVKAAYLECLLKPADRLRFDELFELYITSTPEALLDSLVDPAYPKHLTELFSLLYGYGRLCHLCKNVEPKSCKAHECSEKEPSLP